MENDSFTADTVEGKFPVRNIIAKFPGSKDGIIVIAGHYDTIYPLREHRIRRRKRWRLVDGHPARDCRTSCAEEARRIQRLAAVD